MYYAIELFKNNDISIINISDSHLQEIIEDLCYYQGRIAIYRKDGITIRDNTKITSYYNNRNKRNEIVMNLLESDNNFNENDFSIPYPANDIYDDIIC